MNTMKKSTTALLALCFLFPAFLPAENKNDLQAIKRAVKENADFVPGKEVKWFKILVTDTRTNKDKVRVTLPLSLVELFLRCADDKRVRFKERDYDFDLAKALKELKEMGPMALIEVMEKDEIVKIWLE